MKITIEFENLQEIDNFAAEWLAKQTPVAMHVTAPEPAEKLEAAPTAVMPPQPQPVPMPVYEQPAAPQPTPMPAPAPAPAASAVSLETVTRAAVGLMDQGRKADLLALLTRYGVRSLTELQPDQLGGFYADLQAMGGSQ